MATAQYINTREAARLLGVHENTIRNWEKRGLLRTVRLPGSGFRRYDRQQIEQMHQEMLGAIAPGTLLGDDAPQLRGHVAAPGELI